MKESILGMAVEKSKSQYPVYPVATDAGVWESVEQSKHEFLKRGKDPRTSPYVGQEVAESWIRSRDYGVDPYTSMVGKRLSDEEFSEVLQRKRILIETAIPLMENYLKLLRLSNYTMTLVDEEGALLHCTGDEEEVAAFAALNGAPGAIWSEETAGTTAHSLSLILRRPVQIIGPQNYCLALKNNISSATPIFDESGSVTGALVVVQRVATRAREKTQAHSLGWVSSMGFAIQSQLILKKKNYYLDLMNGTLKSALSVLDEGFITVDNKGQITYINEEAIKVLRLPQENVGDEKLSSILGNVHIDDVILNCESIRDLEIPLPGGQRYLINIEPIPDAEGLPPKGAVVRLSRAEKVNSMVTRRGGAEATYTFESIIGGSWQIENTKAVARRVASMDTGVLLIGESGTGKEMFAQSIHNHYRAGGPFVAINCASMPRSLIESELFGYEAGAFTGAERKGRPGKIELAHGGTLFLDEIGDMPIELQPVLLRVLEEKRVMRLGGTRYIPVDFRVIAATNKDLYRMVEEKRFREDLYFRLAVFKITIPPLRERGDDIIELSRYFVQKICDRMGLARMELSEEVCQKIKGYEWPGNVRQLENAMVYAVNMAQGGRISLKDLPDEILKSHDNGSESSSHTRLPSLREVERRAIVTTLEYTSYNVADASEILGMGKTTLYRKIKEYDLVIP